MSSAATRAAIQVAAQTLRAHPLRSLLSTLGVVMGVASLVAVLAIGDGIERYVRGEIERTTDLQTIAIEARTDDVVDGVRIPRTSFASESAVARENCANLVRGMRTPSTTSSVRASTAMVCRSVVRSISPRT